MAQNVLTLSVLSLATAVGSGAMGATLYSADFNDPGDYAGFVDFGNRLTGDTVDGGGTLTGVTNVGDPQLRVGEVASPLNLTLEDLETITIRMRVSETNNGVFTDPATAGNVGAQLRWGLVPYGSPGATNVPGAGANLLTLESSVADGGGYYILTYDVSSLSDPDDLDSLRFDPTDQLVGAFIEVDYFRVIGVPEPASLALLAVGGLCIVDRRCR
ncbi:MAG: PEP-CTERM sorting domain-containing protein [Planctomycetota bacterium]